MRTKLMAVVLASVLVLLAAYAFAANDRSTETSTSAAAPLACDWNPGDVHKMHFPQLPNPSGWDVNATTSHILGDDWQCSETGPVKDIHFWGSWLDGTVGTLQGFRVSIYSDIPASSSSTGYSMPGDLLWQKFVNITDIEVVEFDPGVLEGWYDPTIPEVLPDNNPLYYQYNICFADPADWFNQDFGTIYWLVIAAAVTSPAPSAWGWKSTNDHFNDDAVWWDATASQWQELFEPLDPTVSMDLSFVITGGGGTTPRGACCYDGPTGFECIETTQDSCQTILFGSYAGDGSTCQPAEACCFQDGSCQNLDPFCCQFVGGTPQGAGTVCLGDANGNMIDDACESSIPRGACCYDGPTGFECIETTQDSCQTVLFGSYAGDGTTCQPDEACCFQDGSCQNLDPFCCQFVGGTPQGPGSVCLGDANSNGIDDACESSAPRGACCYDDPAGIAGQCIETTQDSCINFYFGTYQGDGTTCLGQQACCFPDGSCTTMDALCCEIMGGTPQGAGTTCTEPEACCFQDGSCQTLDPLCCTLLGGTPQGPGTTCTNPQACCLPDGSCQMLDPLCCENLGGTPQPGVTCLGETWACCMPDGSCQELDPACCQAVGGVPQVGTHCTGNVVACCFDDGTCDNVDEACCQALGGVPIAGAMCTGNTEACCFQGGACADMEPACCIAFGGTPQGAGTVCLGDANNNGVDDACESVAPRGACCYQDLASGAFLCVETTQDSCTDFYAGTYAGDSTTCQPPSACCMQDGTCQMLDPICCEIAGGVPQPGVDCFGEVWACCIPGADCINLDPACCTAFGGTPVVGQLCTGAIEACCFQDGTCQNLDPVCCTAFGGTPQGAGTVCLGDNNGNNIDDACEPSARGACCYGDATGIFCIETTQDSCENFYFGTYEGDGTTCQPPQACCFQDGSCQTIDPVCCELYGGTPMGAGTTCSNPVACCLPDGTCETLDPLCCAFIGGTPQPGVTCLGEVWACCIPGADCQNLDPACCESMGGTPVIGQLCSGVVEACCFQDGSCQNLDPICCEALGGTPQGTGSVCLGDNNGNMIDDACEQQLEGACCLDDGTCLIMTEADCIAAGGTYKGDGTVCGIDANGNGIADICENWEPGDPYKMHYAQLPDETGWDTKAFAPTVVADDWQCTETGPVSDIHFWGSWLDGIQGNILGFWISIHADIPASDSPTGYSMPGALLWLEFFDNYNAIPINPPTLEGWYDPTVPPVGVFLPNNHDQYFQYNIFVEPDRWFFQKEGTIYWLDISAVLEDTVITKWGWKSSVDHFNDDAVWGIDASLCTAPDDGGTVSLPTTCPYTPATDTAIIITGGLPTGTTIEANPTILDPSGVVITPGGDLGGEVETYDATLKLEMQGTGELPTYGRVILLPVQIEVHTAPRNPGDPVQSFETDMHVMQGEIFGDPDFDLLRVRAGTGNGLPSPGHTTLTRRSGGDWNVDSFFDIEYRIEFQGAPGSPLEGYGGTTQGTIKVGQGGEKVPAWTDIYEPPDFTQSMDMAFVITGEFVCDCIPGDANNDLTVNISDAVAIISWIFASGPAPAPYATCSGDANCDCTANITDAVFLINWIFAGGPAPCDCSTWLANCGPPLY